VAELVSLNHWIAEGQLLLSTAHCLRARPRTAAWLDDGVERAQHRGETRCHARHNGLGARRRRWTGAKC
jgi:hypothetical protein